MTIHSTRRATLTLCYVAALICAVSCSSNDPATDSDTSAVEDSIGSGDTLNDANDTTGMTDTSVSVDTLTTTPDLSDGDVSLGASPLAELDLDFCGMDVPPGAAVKNGNELHRVTLQAADAVCNDGSPAVIYVSPATDPSHANDWVIFLQGGSFCGGYQACIDRWCGVSYSAAKMSSLGAPETAGGDGILSPSTNNPFGGWNRVLGYYCSSDLWVGDHAEAIVSDPDGAGEPYLLHFRGARILDAAVEALESGVNSDNDQVILDGLSADAQVVFSGSSAGGFGVSHHADALAEAHPNWTLVAVVDGNLQPLRDGMPTSVDEGVGGFNRDSYQPQFVDLWGADLDDSCLAMRAEAWECTDQSVHLLNHLTTPLFIRQDLSDSLLRRPYLMFGASLEEYAEAIQITLQGMATLTASAAEGSALTRAPGTFGTQCGQHTTLSSDAWFGISAMGRATIDDPSNTPRGVAEALNGWIQGNDVALIDDPMGTRTTCATPEDTGD